MSKKIIMLLALMLALFVSSAAFAEEAADGGVPGAFLRFGIGARAQSMGNAFVAVGNDATASYWNPAGLSQLRNNEISFFHVNLFSSDAGYDAIGFAYLLSPKDRIGINWLRQYAGIVQGYSNEGTQTHPFSADMNGILLSYSRKLYSTLFLGSSMKLITQSIDSYAGTGFGLDMSVLYIPLPNLYIGLNAQNVVPPRMRLRQDGDLDIYALNIKMGASFRFNNDKIIFSIDGDKTTDRNFKVHYGAEIWLLEALALRAGLDQTNVTGGFGIRISTFIFDYAFVTHDLGNTHRFGVSFQFGGV